MLCASSVALGQVKPGIRGVCSESAAAQGAIRRAVPLTSRGQTTTHFAVLHLLDPHQVVAEVADAVEAELALDRVDAVRLQEGADLRVLQAPRADHAGLEDLPRRPGGGRLRLDRRVGEAGRVARSL
jgi:hypothetical protein